MILLDKIVQEFDLADFEGFTGFRLERLKGSEVGPALVNRDLLRQAVLPNRFLEKSQGGFLVAAGGEQEIGLGSNQGTIECRSVRL